MLPQKTGGSCIKIGLTGKSILGDYFQEKGTSRRPFLSLRTSFPGRPIFIQFVPEVVPAEDPGGRRGGHDLAGGGAHRVILDGILSGERGAHSINHVLPGFSQF